ncbi:hypothetical protein IB276_22460 [Ensifer sp. ENS04]|uniref:hypothetical protein n=1 Tax=Ensifer sp. ENS04 TaxID=2769281 RepID=UPI00177EA2D2|nr:hypothetical protein [Ensifer sp. ENS04]MBD9542211.1 hypothetical protein [Ensifer sp. ENS04]
MCFSKRPTGQVNAPSYTVAQMGDQYDVTSKPAEEEEDKPKEPEAPEDLTM